MNRLSILTCVYTYVGFLCYKLLLYSWIISFLYLQWLWNNFLAQENPCDRIFPQPGIFTNETATTDQCYHACKNLNKRWVLNFTSNTSLGRAVCFLGGWGGGSFPPYLIKTHWEPFSGLSNTLLIFMKFVYSTSINGDGLKRLGDGLRLCNIYIYLHLQAWT